MTYTSPLTDSDRPTPSFSFSRKIHGSGSRVRGMVLGCTFYQTSSVTRVECVLVRLEDRSKGHVVSDFVVSGEGGFRERDPKGVSLEGPANIIIIVEWVHLRDHVPYRTRKIHRWCHGETFVSPPPRSLEEVVPTVTVIQIS